MIEPATSPAASAAPLAPSLAAERAQLQDRVHEVPIPLEPPVTYYLANNPDRWDYVGRGSFGLVMRYHDPRSGLHLAMKCFQVDDCLDYTEEKSAVELEVENHRNLSHNNILRYYTSQEISLDRGRIFCIFMEYVDGGTLRSKIESDSSLPPETVKDYAFQILKGLAYMHKKRIIHRDLRSQNILVSRQNVIKIADFGISKSFTSNQSSVFNSQVGNDFIRAPEIVQATGQAGRRVDVWSLGIAVFEMSTGELPWRCPREGITLEIVNSDSPALSSAAGADLQRLVKRCLVKEPSQRPHSWVLIEDPMFNHQRNLDRP